MKLRMKKATSLLLALFIAVCSGQDEGTEQVCEGCVEVEVVQVIGIIFADLLVTVGVAILVYYWAQNRKGATAMAPAARPGRQNRAPPVPSPDYEPIRTGNREVYSGLNKRT
ncbi:T-cell surface glycoprotein CD3 epsilon chain-like isoform X7 [Polyodon spathula]|uniref:T-cell surface glycoprotein CD3 epsilon chain-like isoform X7 n=1 Tax=Polyodon spathula TaxID=7913 RepID=UPI001B7DDF3F|nr:T-cell surface glycoprotein CD3 epsilon chain-like isoform X7 [Polyodon spathula]